MKRKMSEKETGFISHLTELRQRLINSLIFLAILFIGCYIFSDHIYGFLVDPYANAVKNDGVERRLIFTALQETFLTYLKVSFFAAFFATSPFILIQIWKFIAPGLYKHEKKATFRYVKKVSCKAVNINLLSLPLSLLASAYGSTKKPYK